ncbi:MAG: hypothetical protein ACTSP3_06245 [Candidatus Heimdallarchaeaceae archaeon]
MAVDWLKTILFSELDVSRWGRLTENSVSISGSFQFRIKSSSFTSLTKPNQND